MVFASERERIKAKVITLGKPGGETFSVAPRSKPLFEFNAWVLAHKLRVALVVCLLVLLGAGLGLLGVKALLVGLAAAFLATLVLARPCP